MVFKFALEYAIRRVQVNEKGFKLNVRHQIVLYARNGNTLGESKHTVKKKKKTQNLPRSNEIGSEVKAE